MKSILVGGDGLYQQIILNWSVSSIPKNQEEIYNPHPTNTPPVIAHIYWCMLDLIGVGFISTIYLFVWRVTLIGNLGLGICTWLMLGNLLQIY